MNNILNFLGLMKKAGKLAYGDEACYDAVRTGRAKALLIASDASPNLINRAKGYAGEIKGELITLPVTKAELGRLLSRESLAVAAVCDKKFAQALIRKLPPECLIRIGKREEVKNKNSEGEREGL